MNEVSMYARPCAYKMTCAAKFPSSLAQVLFNFRQCEDYSKEFFIDNFRNQVKPSRSTVGLRVFAQPWGASTDSRGIQLMKSIIDDN